MHVVSTHCNERQDPRPAGATHRIIYSLYLDLVPLPAEPADNSTALVLPLNPDGMPADRRLPLRMMRKQGGLSHVDDVTRK
jgi:hypothetical protein